MRRLAGLAVALALAALFAWTSRFWYFPWEGGPLWGVRELNPQGDVLGRALRGTGFAEFAPLIWIILVFAILTFAQKLWDRIGGGR